MTNQRFTPRAGLRAWRSVGALSRLLSLVLMTLATPAALSAQQAGVTALLPDEVLPTGRTVQLSKTANSERMILLRFDASTLPRGATVTAARLSLVSSSAAPASQDIYIGRLPYDAGLPARPTSDFTIENVPIIEGQGVRVTTNAAGDAFLAAINAAGGTGRKFSLLLTTPKNISSWYSADSSSWSKNWPRLILEYAVPGQPSTQADGMQAARSPRAFLPLRDGSAGGPFSYTARPFPVERVASYAPVFFNNRVYLISDDGGRRNLRALDSLGNPIWSVLLPGSATGQHLLVSNDGRIFVVGAGRILVYQIDPADPSKPPAGALRDVRDENLLNPSIPPTLGADGGLYFVNGLEVYGLDPSLRQLWKVTLSDKHTSRVTAGPSGQFVYLTTGGEGLVAVNAQTGESFISPLSNQGALRKAENPALHAPVVIRYPDGSEKVYAAADSADDGTLALFNNLKTMPGKGETGAVERAEGAWPLKGFWGQPLPDQQPPGSESTPNSLKVLYAVSVANNSGTLKAVNWLTGAASDLTPQLKADSSYLLSGGNLLTDQAGNRFVWNGSDGGLYAFGTPFSGRLNSSGAGVIPAKVQLYFGNDGTMYANDVDGRAFWAVVPQYTLGADSGGCIDSPTHLRADGVVSRDLTLTAAGNVLLGAEFKVLLGAEFKVRQGTTLSICTGGPR